jgi:hypothetical protein
LRFFFRSLQGIDEYAVFRPLSNYFTPDFATFLGGAKQSTLRSHFENFFDAFKVLALEDRRSIIAKFNETQRINPLLEKVAIDGNILKLSSLPNSIRQITKILFDYLYSTTLKSYGKLTLHYRKIFDKLESNICPFCGIEILNSPNIIQQDYDHMLLISEYIFAAVNMNNLVPTGTECNRINKHNMDVLYNGITRTVFNSAYRRSFNIRVVLTGSTPPSAPTVPGNWVINIQPDNNYTREWLRVYNIKQRYADNVLHKFYLGWFKEFKKYLAISGRLPITETNLINELSTQGLTMKENPLASPFNIVKGALFEFISTHQDNGYRTAILNFVNQTS